MSAVKAVYREFLDIEQSAQFLQEKGFHSCTAQTIKYLVYEKGLLPRPTVMGRKSYWRKRDLERLVDSL